MTRKRPFSGGWWFDLWRDFWAVLGPIVSIVGATYLFVPQLSIEPGARPDPQDPFSTRFAVKNTGRTALYNLVFSCTPGAVGGGFYMHSFNLAGLLPEPSLSPNKTVTKSCQATIGGLQGNVKVEVTVDFDWLWMRFHRAALFVGERGRSEYFLEPAGDAN